MADPPRWLADEMLGRLARYLRFMGFDTAYARGLPDEEVAAWAKREGRTVLTRDVELARRFSPSLLIVETELPRQLAAVRDEFPAIPWEVTFDRCTECNGKLGRWKPPGGRWPPHVPRERVDAGLPVYACETCGHLYWEGSHTDAVRRTIGQLAERESRT
ncbi:MAG: Mut7-C RNAse domain-containing protein [Thermoplasmata archaeon]|nr:Mut7-C RNAse domain-containing protein [Thermoplasmata archaeon]